jgi:hypothetical protein
MVVDMLTAVGAVSAGVPVHASSTRSLRPRRRRSGRRCALSRCRGPVPTTYYRDRVRAALAADVVDAGLCGVVTAVDLEQAPARFADR